MKKITHDVTALIIARITGSITQDEETLLNQLLKKFPQVKALSRFLNEYTPAATVQDPAALEREARDIIKIAERRSEIKRLPLVGAAACMIAVIVLAAKIWGSHTPRQQRVNTVSNDSTNITLLIGNEVLPLTGQKLTVHLDKGLLINDAKQLRTLENDEKDLIATLTVPAGKVYTLQLSDGSKVSLNSATKIKFPIRFKERERRLDLNGEAYFTVNASANKPFIVHLPHTDVKALGTQFNVNSYNVSQPRIALVSGSAKVSSGQDIVELQPGQAATRLGDQLKIGPIGKNETSWLQGEIHIDAADENEIMDLTWRYFHEKLTMAPPQPDYQLDIIINRREHIDSFLVQLAPLDKIERDAEGYHIKR